MANFTAVGNFPGGATAAIRQTDIRTTFSNVATVSVEVKGNVERLFA
jgi:hypothetical protein